MEMERDQKKKGFGEGPEGGNGGEEGEGYGEGN